MGAAKLGTIQKDLNLSNNQFSTVQAILFVGYIPATVPSNILLEKFGRPRVYISLAMTAWGVLSACIGAVHSYGPLVFLRIILGTFEAAFYPGVIFYLSCWYTREEIAKRTALFLCGSWLSGAFSGIIAWGVMDNLQDALGLAAWRWLFIIEGAGMCQSSRI
jgi:MFS family permease